MLPSADITKYYLLLFIATFPIQIFCQQNHVFDLQSEISLRIAVDTTINDNTRLEPFTSQQSISGLAFSGEIVLHSDSSLVRIVLMDENYNEYLIYETYPILSGLGQLSVEEVGEESSLLSNITPTGISIELVDASLYLKEIIMSEKEPHQAATKGALLLQQSKSKIERINRNIEDLGQFWVAGETSISQLSYQEKKSMFGGQVPNFQGFEYYVGGVFVLPGASSKKRTQHESHFPSEFSWKSRHGVDWVTPVKDQGHCGSCLVFGSTAATELLVNLYYNQHLDYDLSEQHIVSCELGACNVGWIWINALGLIRNRGIVLEDCFPYTASDQHCSEICKNPSERINIENWTYHSNKDNIKREIIKGATIAQIDLWKHAAQIVGFKELVEGDHLFVGGYDTTNYISIEQDNPLIGKTAWLCKNSWGESWGNNGYGYFIGDEKGIFVISLEGPVKSMIFDDGDILCTDNDGDGYFNWGIGPKPAHCPDCPDEPDGDDSNPCLGPMDENGNFTSSKPAPVSEDTIVLHGQVIPDLYALGSTIQWYRNKELQDLVHTGNVFPTGHVDLGIYTYHVTQSLAGCESRANEVSLSIVNGIPPPTGHDTAIVEGEPAIITVEGEQGAVYTWYKDPLLSIQLGTGESYETEDIDAADNSYYVTQTLCLIESAPDTLEMKIFTPIFIPDTAFFFALREEGVDTYRDSAINFDEALAVNSLDIPMSGISDLTGIEAFVNLKALDCSGNQLTSLDVSKNPALTYLDCSFNQLTSLDISHNTALWELNLKGIPGLHEVCVWERSFPPPEFRVWTSESSNVCFESDCNGVCGNLKPVDQSDVLIFPNPTKDKITVETVALGRNTFEIISMDGQLKYHAKMNGITQQIDLSFLPKGIYFITFKSLYYIVTKKIIKL